MTDLEGGSGSYNLDDPNNSIPVKTDYKKVLFFTFLVLFVIIIITVSLIFFIKKPQSTEITHLELEKISEKISLAVEKQDPDICYGLKGEYKDNCLLTVAEKTGNSLICEKISSSGYKKYCLQYKKGNSFSINTSRTIYANYLASSNITFNFIEFNYSFNSGNDSANTLLAIFLDDKIVYKAEEKDFVKNKEYYNIIPLGKNYSSGSYLLSIRALPLTEYKSNVFVRDKDIRVGYKDPNLIISYLPALPTIIIIQEDLNFTSITQPIKGVINILPNGVELIENNGSVFYDANFFLKKNKEAINRSYYLKFNFQFEKESEGEEWDQLEIWINDELATLMPAASNNIPFNTANIKSDPSEEGTTYLLTLVLRNLSISNSKVEFTNLTVNYKKYK